MDFLNWASRRLARWVWCVLACCLALPCAAQTVPTADFFKPAAFSSMRMSPSGKRLCAAIPRADGRLSLAVLDLEDLSKSNIVAGYMGYDVWGVEWVNDERLVFRIYDQSRPAAQQRGTGLFTVSATGGEAPRMLIKPQWNRISEVASIVSRALQPNHGLHTVLRDGSNDVVVAEYVYGAARDLTHVNLKRVDTTTGIARGISAGAPSQAMSWTLDAAGVPRVVEAVDGATATTYWKPKADGEWVKRSEGDRYGNGAGFDPIRVDAHNRLYATVRGGKAADTQSLVVYDMTDAAERPRELLATPGFDFSGSLVLNSKSELLGIRYLTDARATHWLDPAMKKIQAQVDALLPGTVNRLDCGQCDQPERLLVTSRADRQPSAYRLFDSKTGTLAPLTDSRPWIQPKTMAARDMVRITARDGLDMPVHVTRPNGANTPLPTIVLVHGGPWVRGGEWEWDADSQFLASRGYVVIEPEFRGSTGFGRKHFRAGWKQWGLAMQDDVADAALWAVKQGYADPKRICIAGASYGGYATLMGLIRHPEIFRCGFQWVGVTDIELMYTIHWSDFSDDWRRYGMPRLIGDLKSDADQLAATSPVKQAGKITQPLLMAYGGADRRVPIDHGTIFRDAVRKTNPNVEWIVYADEGHGWRLPANSVDFWNRVERFLDKNLKNAP